MEQKEINKLYAQSEQCLDAMVKKALRKNSFLDKDELRSEANLIFCECAENYDPKIGPFLNFLTTTLYFSLFKRCRELSGERRTYVNYTEKWQRTEALEELTGNRQFEQEYLSVNPERNHLITATIANMSSDAQNMTQVILDPPEKFSEQIESCYNKNINKTKLFRYFREQLGWSQRRFLSAFTELQSGLSEVWV